MTRLCWLSPLLNILQILLQKILKLKSMFQEVDIAEVVDQQVPSRIQPNQQGNQFYRTSGQQNVQPPPLNQPNPNSPSAQNPLNPNPDPAANIPNMPNQLFDFDNNMFTSKFQQELQKKTYVERLAQMAKREREILNQQMQIDKAVQTKLSGANGYKYGDFSKFAYERETQLSVYEKIINNVVRQALQSHNRRVKQISTMQTSLNKKSRNNFQKIKQIINVERESQFKQFFQDAPMFYISKTYKKLINNDVQEAVKQFIQSILLANQYIYVQNQLLQKTELDIANHLKTQTQNFIPMRNYENLYIKDSSLSFSIQMEGSFYDKQQLKNLTLEERTKIIETVKAFLLEKKILIKQETLMKKIEEVIVQNK